MESILMIVWFKCFILMIKKNICSHLYIIKLKGRLLCYILMNLILWMKTGNEKHKRKQILKMKIYVKATHNLDKQYTHVTKLKFPPHNINPLLITFKVVEELPFKNENKHEISVLLSPLPQYNFNAFLITFKVVGELSLKLDPPPPTLPIQF